MDDNAAVVRAVVAAATRDGVDVAALCASFAEFSAFGATPAPDGAVPGFDDSVACVLACHGWQLEASLHAFTSDAAACLARCTPQAAAAEGPPAAAARAAPAAAAAADGGPLWAAAHAPAPPDREGDGGGGGMAPLGFLGSLAAFLGVAPPAAEAGGGGPARAGPVAARRFLSGLEGQCGGAPAWPFVAEGFTRASARAAREARFLLVYLHSPLHDDTPRFCAGVLGDAATREYVAATFVAWGGDVCAAAEPLAVSNELRCTTFPFLALLSCEPGRTKLVDTCEGADCLDPAAVRARLGEAVRRAAADLAAQQAAQANRDAERNLMANQNREFEETLAADQRRDRERQQELEAEAQAARDARDQAELDAAVELSKQCVWPVPRPCGAACSHTPRHVSHYHYHYYTHSLLSLPQVRPRGRRHPQARAPGRRAAGRPAARADRQPPAAAPQRRAARARGPAVPVGPDGRRRVRLRRRVGLRERRPRRRLGLGRLHHGHVPPQARLRPGRRGGPRARRDLRRPGQAVRHGQ